MIVGFIVILAIAGMIFFASWIIGGLDKNRYSYYTVLFEDAVSGLESKSAVSYKGIRVGEVMDIVLDPTRPDLVQVNVKVKDSTPIQSYSDVSLGIQGITGQASIEIETRAGEPSPPERQDGFPHPVLQGSSKQLGKLVADVPEIAANVLAVTEKINGLLDDKTVENLQRTIENFEKLSNDFNGLLSDQNVETFSKTLKNAEQASGMIGALSQSFDDTANAFEDVAQEMGKAIDKSQQSVGKIAEQGLDQVLSLARESRDMAEQIKSLAESFKENPSQLLYKQKEDTVKIEP